MIEKIKAVVRAEGICKSFPGVQALQNVDLSVYPGEVHGLIGENGAGKSTLIKTLMGVYHVDNGSFYINDEKVEIRSPLDARKFGLTAVYQDVMIAPELSVGENFFLGRLPKKPSGFVDWEKVYTESQSTLNDLGINVDPRQKISNLSFCDQMMVTIAKIVRDQAILMIFDEPTAILTNEETETLFNIIRRLKSNGIAIIYISHRLEEIFEICDTVTVLKDGVTVGTKQINEVNEDLLVSMMVGRSIEEMYNIKRQKPGEVLLEVKNITHEPNFRDVSFSLRQGEVVGFYGLIGSGRTEILRSIFGVDQLDSGKVYHKGKEVHISNPERAMKYGIGLVPEDRKLQGLALPLSVSHNINITAYGDISKLGFIQGKKEKERSTKLVNELNIRTPSVDQLVEKLSGGNQQKVAIAKWIVNDADILFLDEPTTGVDVGAKVEIYHLVEALLERGKSVVLVSSYLPEVMGLADRIYVMAEGELMGEVLRENADEELLLRMASKVVKMNSGIPETDITNSLHEENHD